MIYGINGGFVKHWGAQYFTNNLITAKKIDNEYPTVIVNRTNGVEVGNYILKYKGNEPKISGSANILERRNGCELLLQLTGSPDGVVITMDKETQLIHLTKQYATSTVWNSEFLSQVSRYSIIRCLDFQSIPTTSVVMPNQHRFGNYQDVNNGISPEYLIPLAKESGCDIWVHIPQTASDNYIEWLGALMAKSPTNTYVEYANELWLSGTKPSDDFSKRTGHRANTREWASELGKEIKRVFSIFEKAFNESNPQGKLFKVLAGQMGIPYMTNLISESLGVDSYDVLSTAAYAQANIYPYTNLDLLTANLISYIDTIISDRLDEYRLIADKPLITYEGGISVNNEVFARSLAQSPKAAKVMVALMDTVIDKCDGYLHYKMYENDHWGSKTNVYGPETPVSNILSTYLDYG